MAKLYIVRTAIGRESQVVDFLSTNAKRYEGVYSIIYPHGMSGYIIVEADTDQIVKQISYKHSSEVIHNSLVQQTNKRIWELGKKEMDRVKTIRRSLKDREPALSVETAFPLSKEQQANIVRTFSALADKNVKLDVVLKKDLGSGVRIRLGDFIINNSLDALLDEIEKEASMEVNNLIEKHNEK